MGRINLKTDYKDGQILYSNELNVNNNVTMLGVNDNFDRINRLDSLKADSTYVDNALSNKADLAVLNTKIQELNLLKADKTSLANKADQSEVDSKASKAELSAGLQTKADLSYVDTNLANKVSKKDFNESLSSKADESSIGDLDELNTNDKSNLVNAINSLNRETLPIATTESLGAVKPDGVTVTVDIDGTIHAVGGGGSGSGTSDYNALSNIPSINGVVVKGNLTANDLKLMSKSDINSVLETKANKDDVYDKDEIDVDIKLPLSNKADKSYVDTQLLDKANTVDVYNKEKVDELISTSESLLNAKLLVKADAENVYDKTNVDKLIKTRANNLSFVNNKLQLLSDGNILGDSVEIEVDSSDVVITNEQPDDFKLWINNGEVASVASEVVNSLNGNETDKAPSVQAINKALSYSKEEQVIGTWIDGRPLYRKVIDTGVLPNTTTKNVAHEISNAVFIKMEGIAYADNIYLPLPYVDSANKLTDILLRIVGGNIVIISGSDRSAFTNSHVTLEYIKTTDSVATTSLEKGGNE